MLLWKRYGNNKMAAVRIMSLILHLQQYSHRLNLFFFAKCISSREVVQLVEALCYKTEGRGFDSRQRN